MTSGSYELCPYCGTSVHTSLSDLWNSHARGSLASCRARRNVKRLEAEGYVRGSVAIFKELAHNAIRYEPTCGADDRYNTIREEPWVPAWVPVLYKFDTYTTTEAFALRSPLLYGRRRLIEIGHRCANDPEFAGAVLGAFKQQGEPGVLRLLEMIGDTP